MTKGDWAFTAAIIAVIVAVLGWAATMEWRGYCISAYTCTANYQPKIEDPK